MLVVYFFSYPKISFVEATKTHGIESETYVKQSINFHKRNLQSVFHRNILYPRFFILVATIFFLYTRETQTPQPMPLIDIFITFCANKKIHTGLGWVGFPSLAIRVPSKTNPPKIKIKINTLSNLLTVLFYDLN